MEGIALGVDLMILAWCMKEYVSHKRNIKFLKEAPQLTINGDLKNFVSQQKDKKVPYASVSGIVTPIGLPMHSVMSPSATGVVIKVSAHHVTRGVAGYWTDQHKLINVSSNAIPFELCNDGQSIEIIDALSAAVLDMDVVYDNYKPSSSYFKYILSLFFDVRETGLQTTEEVLRDGSLITAIGELKLYGETLRLQPSSVGPFFLTTSTRSIKNEIINRIKILEKAKSSML